MLCPAIKHSLPRDSPQSVTRSELLIYASRWMLPHLSEHPQNEFDVFKIIIKL